MEIATKRVFLTVLLLSWCPRAAQGHRDEEDRYSAKQMRTIENAFKKILQKLEDHEHKLAVLDGIQKKLKSIEDQLLGFSDCARRCELESFYNMTLTELQDIRNSLGQCSTVDQVSNFQNIMQADECNDDTHECSEFAECNDKLMKYKCTCLPGYYGDGFTCLDVNECTAGNVTCGRNELCSNTPGSYECSCREGYLRIRGSCQDTTCTAPSLFLPTLGCVMPVFTKMTWDEAKGLCEAMGKRLLQDISPEDIEPLGMHFGPLMEDYPQPWIGLRNHRWTSSEAEVPEEVWAEATPGGGCGNLDLRPTKLGVWDGSCYFQDYALCQSV